jgi:hypothetical protein
MDPRHKLYKSFDKLAVDSEEMSARTDTEAAQVQATSGVTMEGLKKKLEEQLGATYVEIEDMSGKRCTLYCFQSCFWEGGKVLYNEHDVIGSMESR